jgi:hypothetical protein
MNQSALSLLRNGVINTTKYCWLWNALPITGRWSVRYNISELQAPGLVFRLMMWHWVQWAAQCSSQQSRCENSQAAAVFKLDHNYDLLWNTITGVWPQFTQSSNHNYLWSNICHTKQAYLSATASAVRHTLTEFTNRFYPPTAVPRQQI